jgi:hypothetical protein
MAKKLRPPKPKDRISAPRFKMKKATATTQSQGGKKAPLTNVKALISADPAPEYFNISLNSLSKSGARITIEAQPF